MLTTRSGFNSSMCAMPASAAFCSMYTTAPQLEMVVPQKSMLNVAKKPMQGCLLYSMTLSARCFSYLMRSGLPVSVKKSERTHSTLSP